MLLICVQLKALYPIKTKLEHSVKSKSLRFSQYSKDDSSIFMTLLGIEIRTMAEFEKAKESIPI